MGKFYKEEERVQKWLGLIRKNTEELRKMKTRAQVNSWAQHNKPYGSKKDTTCSNLDILCFEHALDSALQTPAYLMGVEYK